MFSTELLPGSTWYQIRGFASHAAGVQVAGNYRCIWSLKEASGMPRTRFHIIFCVQLRPPWSQVVCCSSSPLLPITVIRKGLPGRLTLHPGGTTTACSPLERDLLALDEETVFKAEAEVFTEFIDKISPLWAQIVVEHHLKTSFKSPFSS